MHAADGNSNDADREMPASNLQNDDKFIHDIERQSEEVCVLVVQCKWLSPIDCPASTTGVTQYPRTNRKWFYLVLFRWCKWIVIGFITHIRNDLPHSHCRTGVTSEYNSYSNLPIRAKHVSTTSKKSWTPGIILNICAPASVLWQVDE